MSILSALPHTSTAKIRTRTRDSMGGSKDTFTTVFTGRACWRQLARDSEVREYEKRGMSVTHKVYFTSDPSLDERHILVIGSTTYEVRSAAEATAGQDVAWRVMVEETTTGSTP